MTDSGGGGRLIPWFRGRAREFPWRTPQGVPRDPWGTLLCEVMSQQTRLEVVVPRWKDWVRRWPRAEDLAAAPSDEVLAAWAGLGYYSRARNLHAAARSIAEHGWPRTGQTLSLLPGVGPYTAAAVASLCFGEHLAVLDGNVARVLARVYGLDVDPRSGAGKRILSEHARLWIKGSEAGAVNEATMELGATVCRLRQPLCGECPLAPNCCARQTSTQSVLPRTSNRAATVNVASEVLVLIDEKERIALRSCLPGELLAGLWSLPHLQHLPVTVLPDLDPVTHGIVTHTITHHRIRWTVRKGRWTGELPAGFGWFSPDELSNALVSSLPRKALELVGLWKSPATT